MSQLPILDEVCRESCAKLTVNQLITVGKNIKRLRLKSKQTQADIAFWIFSDKSSISSLERGVSKNITLFTLIKIAELFKIKVEDLLKDD